LEGAPTCSELYALVDAAPPPFSFIWSHLSWTCLYLEGYLLGETEPLVGD